MYNKKIEISGINNGYQYFIDYEHPLATGNSGRVYLHRHIASTKIGRWVTGNERIYVHRSGKLFHVKSRYEGPLWVIPTELTSYEKDDNRWQVNPLNSNKLPDNFSNGW